MARVTEIGTVTTMAWQKLRHISHRIAYTGYGRLFFIVLLLKIGTGFVYAPELYVQWWIPFIKNFVASGYTNPWDSFLALGGSQKAFPYGTGMLWILTIPFSLQSLFTNIVPDVVSQTDIFLMKIPILLADLGIFYILIRPLKLSSKKSVVVYWCSPVVFYIDYLHGQLDTIPMLLIFTSLVLLINHRFLVSAVVLGLGLTAKANLLVAVYFMIVYTFRKKQHWSTGLSYLGMIVIAYFVMIGWVFLSPGYQSMVLGAEERTWIYLNSIHYRDAEILLVPLVLGLLYLRFSLYTRINNDLLIIYIGLAFTVLLLLIPSSAPGWYMWMVPFLCYYYINPLRFHPAPLVLFSLLFLMYFMVRIPYPINLIDPELKSLGEQALGRLLGDEQLNRLSNLIFTLLKGIVAYIAGMMYIHGVHKNEVHSEDTAPITIGIGGNSGSGKDTLCHLLRLVLGEKNIIQADGDDHHKWERGHRMWKIYTHLNPKANDLFLQFNHTQSLRKGRRVTRSAYNHETGNFSDPEVIEPSKYILVSGLHPFYLRSMRELIDVKIYLDTEEELRTYWKVSRDVKDRDYTRESVIQNMKEREEDAGKYIHPQKKYADVIIRYTTVDQLTEAQIRPDSQLRLDMTLDNSFNLEALVHELSKVPSLQLEHWYEDTEKQYFSVSGTIASEHLSEIASQVVPNLYDLVDLNMQFEDDLKGVVQIIFLCVLSHKRLY